MIPQKTINALSAMALLENPAALHHAFKRIESNDRGQRNQEDKRYYSPPAAEKYQASLYYFKQRN